jgi:uncharacterized repeat protein (TIGR02543 family)
MKTRNTLQALGALLLLPVFACFFSACEDLGYKPSLKGISIYSVDKDGDSIESNGALDDSLFNAGAKPATLVIYCAKPSSVSDDDISINVSIGDKCVTLSKPYTNLNNFNLKGQTNRIGITGVNNLGYITVTAEPGGITTRYKVSGAPPTPSISLNPKSFNIQVGQTRDITVTYNYVTPTSTTWSSSDTTKATVSNGTVTAVGAGTVTITATVQPGNLTATCSVNVTPAPTYGITLSPTSHTFTSAAEGYGNQTEQIVTITNTGNQATGPLSVALSSGTGFTLSTTSISSISTTGTFTVKPSNGLYAGTYTATVTVSGGNGISGSLTVNFTVTDPVAIPHTVTFNKNDGTTTTPETITVTPPATTVVTLPTEPTRANYTFAGWNTEPNGSGSAFTGSTAVTTDITVYAIWTSTVTFNKNDGTTTTPETIGVTPPKTTVDALPTEPTRSGYSFVEWNTLADGTGAKFDTSTTVTTGNITVYAKWVATYTVTFDKNGGDTDASPTTKTVTYPATTVVTLPTAPTLTGNTFLEWNTQTDGSGTAFTATTPVTADIIVYAKWTPTAPGAVISIKFGISDASTSTNLDSDFILSKTGAGTLDTSATLSVSSGTGVTYKWFVNSIEVSGSANAALTLNAATATYPIGSYVLRVEVMIGTVPYTKTVNFKVVP